MTIDHILQIKYCILNRLGNLSERRETRDIEATFLRLADAIVKQNLKSILREICVVHDIVSDLVDLDFAHFILKSLEFIIPVEVKRNLEPLSKKKIYFVWIGCISPRSLKFIEVWKNSNPDYEVILWYDSHFLLAGCYSRIMRSKFISNPNEKSDYIDYQNRAFNYLVSKMDIELLRFDEAVIRFFMAECEEIGQKLERQLKKARLSYQTLRSRFILLDVQNFRSQIMDAELYKFYCREIMLRGNLAAASDILRISILYNFGGIYVDCDTLPNLEHIFVRSDAYCRQRGINSSLVDVYKSEAYLAKIDHFSPKSVLTKENEEEINLRRSKIAIIRRWLERNYDELLRFIEEDAAGITERNAYRPLKYINFCPKSILLSGDKTNVGCFNNNIVIANPKSAVLSIVIREMRRRYHYIENMDAIYSLPSGGGIDASCYYSRLLNYRYDTMGEKDNTTIILTGPGLIFEVVIGIGFKVLNLADNISPVSVAAVLYSPKFGMSFFDQTLHTFDHTQSTWMNIRGQMF